MNKFSIDHWYKHYLEKMKLDKMKMSKYQEQETKRAFYGGFGSLLVLSNDYLSELEEEKAMEILDNLFKEVNDFFEEEALNKK